jgi:hypothetical protein
MTYIKSDLWLDIICDLEKPCDGLTMEGICIHIPPLPASRSFSFNAQYAQTQPDCHNFMKLLKRKKFWVR